MPSPSPDGRTDWVANWSGNSVTTLNLTSNTPTTTTPVGDGPGDLTVGPDGRTVLVMNWDEPTVSVLDATRPGAPARTIRVDQSPKTPWRSPRTATAPGSR